jgi:hypothetical protein
MHMIDFRILPRSSFKFEVLILLATGELPDEDSPGL